jgi:hypothetical protein
MSQNIHTKLTALEFAAIAAAAIVQGKGAKTSFRMGTPSWPTCRVL